MNMQETQLMAENMQKESAKAYKQGVADTLAELREVYGNGIEDTDIWAEYMQEEKN
jgi:uncharacterized membrane protein (DUF106 family)